MKKIMVSTLVLCIITLVAGMALATVYEVTKEPIAEAEAQAVARAYQAVFPEATAFVEQTLSDVTLEGDSRVDKAVLAQTQDSVLGYVLMVTSPNGYGGNITIAMGVTPDGALTGVSIISQSETAGLGAKCEDDKFTSQFAGITGDKVEYTKTQPTADNQIQAISGATVTTSAVVDAVNTGLSYVKTVYFDVADAAGGDNT